MAERVSGNLGDGRLDVVASDERELLGVAFPGNVERVFATDSSARVRLLEAGDRRLLLGVVDDSTCLILTVLDDSIH